jgi:hypothetical protein
MNELVPQQTTAALAVRVSENPLLKPNVLSEVEDEVFQTVQSAVARCYADLNQRVPEASQNEYLLNQLTDNILKNYPSLRLAEISIAFSAGIRGQYGEYFGLSVISFEKFLTGYLESDHRQKLVEDKHRLMIEEKTEPTAEEKFNTGKQLCLDAFARVKSEKPIGLSELTVFAFLNGLSMIDKSYKVGIMQQAMEQTVSEKERELAFATELYKRRKINTELEVLRENIAKDILSKGQYEQILQTAKRISLNNYFRDLMLNEEDLGQLIEAHRP